MVWASPWGKRWRSAPKSIRVSFVRSVLDQPSSISTQEMGTCLAWNSSILLTIACSLTSRPNESQVHHPNPVSASGNGRSLRVRIPSWRAAVCVAARMAIYGSDAQAIYAAVSHRVVRPTRLEDSTSRKAVSSDSVAGCPLKSARISVPQIATNTSHSASSASLLRRNNNCVRSGSSDGVRTQVGRIHHSLCWYSASMVSSLPLSTPAMVSDTSIAWWGSNACCS